MGVKVFLIVLLLSEISFQALLKFGNIPFVTLGKPKKNVLPFKDSRKLQNNHPNTQNQK
jgi:hypothetical protein